MMKPFKEQIGMPELRDYFDKSPNGHIYGEFANGNVLVFEADTWYQGDNDLEPDDPKFEEFEIGVYRIVKTIRASDPYYKPGALFEINYHTFPAKIVYDYKG